MDVPLLIPIYFILFCLLHHKYETKEQGEGEKLGKLSTAQFKNVHFEWPHFIDVVHGL